MIEVGLLIERGADTLVNINTSFPVLPSVGQSVFFWHEREKLGALVESVFFDQVADGSFVVIVTAKVPVFR